VAQEKAAAVSQELAELEAKVAKCHETLEAQVAEIATRKDAVHAATASMQQADSQLLEAQNVQKQADVACTASLAEKEACIGILEGSYKSLKESKWGNDFAKQREQVEEVVSFMKSVKTVSVPSSLIFIEGPSVLKSKKESRGAHAEQIFADIEAIFNKHLGLIEDRLKADTQRSEEVLPQTKAAEEAAHQALQAKESYSKDLAAAELRKVELEAELQRHKDSVTAQRQVVATTAAKTEKIVNDQVEIEQAFNKGMSAFKILRDQSPEAFATLSDTPSPGRSTPPPPIPQEA
jgi:chromosome segregation ATPase